MVSDNANISANKLDITSLFTVINGSKETINSARVFVDADSQTLDVAFKQMTTDVQTAVTKADGVYTLAEAANNNAASALAQVQTVTETVSTQGTQLTEVQGQISSKVWKQDISTMVSELEIGGRNLYTGTKNFTGTGWKNLHLWKNDGTYNGFTVKKNSTWWNGLYQVVEVKQGEIYTFSGYAKANGGGCYIYATGAGASFDTESKSIEISSEWQRISHTFVVTKSGGAAFRFEQSDKTKNIWVCGLKLEKGNKPTDWTPAPEDIDSAITSLEGTTTTLSNQYTSLNQTLSSLTATVNANTTAITQKADGSTVTTLQNNLTSLEANLNGFKSEVSSTYTTKTDFNNLEIGGRNLYTGTKDFTTEWPNIINWETDGTYKGFTVKKRSGQLWQALWQSVNVQEGEVYTYSAYAKTDNLNNFSIGYFMSGASCSAESIKTVCPTEVNTWTRVSATCRITKAGTMHFGIEPKAAGTLWVCGLKLEQGNKATDWTPAPEDYSTTEQMNSAIKQSADSIKTEVNGTLNNYATTASLELKVSKTDNSQIISMINASADVIKLSSNRFQLDSTYAKINLDGTVAFTGGTIGGFQITSTGINAANGLVGMNITSGWAFHAGNIIAGTDRTVFCVGHEGNVYCHNFWSDNAMIVGGSINVNNNFIVDSSGNLTSKGSSDFQCATVYANDFHSRGSIYAASNIDAGSTVGCNDILVKNNAYVREQFYYWYNDSWVRLRDYITAIINGG